MEKPKDGSVFGLSWSNDSTQLACGCGTGRVGIGHIIERYGFSCFVVSNEVVNWWCSSRIDWRHLEFVLTDSKVITVSNCETELKDKIELKDRLVKMSVGFGYLIVLTSSQGLIYKWKLPTTLIKFLFVSFYNHLVVNNSVIPQSLTYVTCQWV